MHSLILQTTTRLLSALLLLFSLFALLRGHDEPVGGFIGGLLASSAFALYGLGHGVTAAQALLRVHPRSVIAAGVAMLLVAALAGVAAGSDLLRGLWLADPIPGVGKLSTILLFDLGVYLVVVGAVVLILFTLGEED
jgi:multicomponent Na+:H+ antiporter subunit B